MISSQNISKSGYAVTQFRTWCSKNLITNEKKIKFAAISLSLCSKRDTHQHEISTGIEVGPNSLFRVSYGHTLHRVNY